MSVSRDTVEHIARLAYIGLGTEEIERLATELSGVLEHIDRLRRVDTTGVEPTSGAVPNVNVLRPDQPGPSWPSDDAVANAARHTPDLFEVPGVLD
ncbi:MAG TPA: Asp-tRNA(Asn)/Glu-tRNA(Gln) amidotransferase subunit GatC [Chloroflexota bacterium]|nr:Asp-tRNA(Asn)/Glu-tRNA(Gln) amidotransferase subunit GatC [Chloroflexota bacterium]